MRKSKPNSPLRLRVCALGELHGPEFADAWAWLTAHAEVCPLTSDSVTDRIDWFVLPCARRGQFTAAVVHCSRRAAPLARIVALTGSWCDGPWRRASDLLGGATIVPWHRWTAWASVNLQQIARRRAASWSLPETSTADELADFWSVQPLGENRGLILIDTRSAESAEVLADVVRAGGFSAVWKTPSGDDSIDGVRAIVCEADDARPATLDRIAQLSRRFASSPVVAVISFPRTEDIERILAAGAAAVVAKPFTLHEILAQLGDALRRAGKSRAAAA